MAITRTAIVDDDGTRTTGTIWNNAWKTELYDQIDAADVATAALAPALPGTSAPTTTGTQTALAIPTGTGDLVLYLNNATLLTIQGIAAGLSGQRLTLVSKGAGQVDLAHAHASGTALGKLALFATTGLTSLAAGSGVAVFQYDLTLTQWRLVSHEQGAYITAPFSAGHYTSSGTFTVEAGDVGTMSYKLEGRKLTVAWYLFTLTVAGTPTTLSIGNGAWGGFTVAKSVLVATIVNNAGGGNEGGYAQVTAGGSSIALSQTDAGTWSNATNTSQAFGQLTFEVN